MQIHFTNTKPFHLRWFLLTLFLGMLFCSIPVVEASVTIAAAGKVVMSSSGKAFISQGNWSNSGTFTPGTGTVIFNDTGNQSITKTGGETFNNLTNNKSSGTLTLNNNVTVTNTLTMTTGNISTGSNTLTLGSGSEGTLSRTSGTIIGNFARHIAASTGSRDFPVGTASNHRPFTVNYTSAPTSAGTLTVSHTDGSGSSALPSTLDDSGYQINIRSNLFWTATAATLAGGTYNLDLDASGQAGITDSANLRIIRSTDGGSTFGVVGTHSNGSGTVAKRTGIPGTFSLFYIGANSGDNSLPVTLSLFTAIPSSEHVLLQWRTEMEIGNVGFTIYRSEQPKGNYIKIGFVRGAVNSDMPIDYHFMDNEAEAGKTYYYYIEDVDIAGVRTPTEPIKVVVLPAEILPAEILPAVFRLWPNYPNPFNPETWLPYDLAADADVTIRIYDVKGSLVRTLDLGQQSAGFYRSRANAAYWDGRNDAGEKVASGIYFYQLRAGDFSDIRRMLTLK